MTTTNKAHTLAEVAEQRKANADAVKAIREKASKSRAEWEKMSDGAKVSYFKTTPAEMRIMREWDEAAREAARLEKVALVLRHNYRAIMSRDVLPVLVEILKKYDGKKAGEKTRQRIAEEMRTACGCSVWFDRNFSSQKSEEMKICERLDDWRAGEEISITTRNHAAIIDEENTINGKLTVDDLRSSAGEYIEDPAARVEEIEKAEKAVEEAKKAANAAINARNALIVDGYKYENSIY